MDAAARIKACLDKWSNGGEAECRSYLASAHGRIYESAHVDVLMTAYQALIRACLSSKDSKPRLAVGDMAGFIQSIVDELPSSSSPTSERSRSLVLFGELLVDVLWTIDSELSDVITDADAILKKADKNEEGKETAETIAKADIARKTAQSDRETLSTFLKALLRAEVVEASICRERLDSWLLSATGLIGDRDAFDRREIRARTGLFYKQNKFNLLREQSEGYSKLTIGLISSLGPPNVPATATPMESFQAVQTRASAIWERVVSLIGYFDLDPNRALDIILDVFSVNIATHWQFFLALLACSPWVGENTRLKDWSEGMKVERNSDQYRGKTLDEVLRLAENNAKGARPATKPNEPSKPRVLAQVLGFKFNHYQSQDTMVPCPRGLYLVAALLIREDFVSLEDLYPHLSPSDEDMPKLRQKYLDDVQSRIKSSSNNLLSMAAPLESSSYGASAKSKTPVTEAKPVQDVKETPAQKAMLAVALLSVGVLRPALALLSKYPWLVDVHRELADLLLRVLKTSINPLFDKLFNKERNKGFLQPRARYISPGVLVMPVRKPQLTLCAPPPPSTQTQDFVFFYPHWSDWVPICETSDDVIDVIEPLMRFVGVHISRDNLFLTKLLRIGRHHLLQSLTNELENKDAKRPASVITEPENGIQEFWLQVARRYLLPALSMLPGNAVCTVEVWSILRFYDLTVRWRLYGEWRDKTYKSHPELNAQRILREREAKGILRRLSSQTVESLAGAVAKMAHANPCLFFTNAVNQIQAYDNFTDVVIQALRFATNMGFDVLVFLVIDALANPQKERVKEDGANTADWLQSLATFSGALFRRYSTDLSSLLKYIVHQLYNGQTSEIVVLEKVILRMAGIEPLPSLSDSQVTAMAGGPTLRTEAIASDLRGAGLDSSEAQTKGPQRLGKSLIDTGLAFPILVQVAQQRQACIFKARDAHLKSIAHLFDATHGVLFQYLELLTTPTVVPLEDYRRMIPSLPDLVNVYGISPPIALQIYRPMLNDAIYTRASEWCKAREAEKIERAEAAEKRLRAALAAKRESPNNSTASAETTASNLSTDQSKAKVVPNGVPAENIELDVTNQKASDGTVNKADTAVEMKTETTELDPWVPELRALFDACKQIAPGNVFDAIGPGFYLSFWQMSSYDLYYPKEKYAELEKNLLTTGDALNAKVRQAERSTDKLIRATAVNIKLQRDRYYAAVSDLRKEKAIQETVFRYTTEKGGRLDREKDHWFSHVLTGSAKAATLIQSLIENCIQPRCLLSPMDAVYCARLIRTLHEQGTPGFHTLMCYDKLLGDHVKVVIFSCSENEARNYGRFLKGVLQDLYEWHKDQKAYEANSYRKEDSKIALLPGLQTHWSKDGPSSTDDLLKWTGFKSFLKKCHRKLGQSFTECIQAGDFMHVYNAVLVLKEIIDVFPLAAVNEVVGSSIDLEIQRLVQSEERGDLKILARAYSSSLKKREKLWAMPKEAQPVKTAPVKVTSSTTTAQVEKSREPVVTVPTGPRSAQTSASEKTAAIPVERPSSAAKFNVESVPRPEVVKRNREPKVPEMNVEVSKKEEPMQVYPQPNGHNQDRTSNVDTGAVQKDDARLPNQSLSLRTSSRLSASLSSTDLRKEVLQGTNASSRPGTPVPSASVGSMQSASKESPHSSPRPHDRDQGSPMAPPAEPSQAPHAQELRNARRQERATNSPREVRPDIIDSSARRSLSPASRPGTRNASADSKTSEGRRERRRHERTSETDAEDNKKPTNADMPSRAERSHRDTHGRSERSGRDRIPGSSTRDAERERDLDREKARDRDRHGDRQRDGEREKSHRSERESHRDRNRERERERGDRDKDRDRHRRDEKDRERERKLSGTNKEPGAPLEHPLPSRPDTQRHRTHTDSSQGDVTLGKRRRTPDDESDRNAKRSSRQRDDRSRKTSDKESSREQNRDFDRRRTDRDAQENEQPSKESVPEKAEKNFDRLRDSDVPSAAAPLKVTVPPPSAPRAMAGPSPRIGGRAETSPVVTPRERDQERDWEARDRGERTGRGDRSHADLRTDRSGITERDDRERDRSDRIQRTEREWKEGPGRPGQNGATPSPSLGSLRDRISSAPGNPPMAGNLPGKPAYGEPDRDDYNERLKRSLSDRDRDALQGPAPAASNVPSPKPTSSKRIRIDRSRLAGDGASSKRTVRQ